MKHLISVILALITVISLPGCVYLGMDSDKADEYDALFIKQLAEYDYDNYWFEIIFQWSTSEERQIRLDMIDGEPLILIRSMDECVLYEAGIEKRFCVATGEESVTEVNWRDYDFVPYIDQTIDFVKAFDGRADNRIAREHEPVDGTTDIDIMYSYYDADFPFKEDLSLIFFLQDDNDNPEDDLLDHVNFQNHMIESLVGNDSIYAHFYIHGEMEPAGYLHEFYQHYLDGTLPSDQDEPIDGAEGEST